MPLRRIVGLVLRGIGRERKGKKAKSEEAHLNEDIHPVVEKALERLKRRKRKLLEVKSRLDRVSKELADAENELSSLTTEQMQRPFFRRIEEKHQRLERELKELELSRSSVAMGVISATRYYYRAIGENTKK